MHSHKINLNQEITSPPLNSIGQSLLPIDKTSSALKMMLTEKPDLVFICPRLLIKSRVASLGDQYFYVPPQNEKTNFLTEQLVIAVPKDFKLKPQINRL